MVIKPRIHLKEPVTIGLLLSLAFFRPVSVQLFCRTRVPVPQICHKLTTFPFKNVLSLLDTASMFFLLVLLHFVRIRKGTCENKHIANADKRPRQYLYALLARS